MIVDPTPLESIVRDTAERSGLSGAVSVSHGGKRLIRAGFGYADRSNRIENTAETRFGIASGTKTITALAAMVLADRGMLQFDSRISDLVNIDFPNFSPDITIHHLLTHTSGIFDYYDEELITDFSNFSVAIPWSELETPGDYLPLFRNEGMKFAPGERFSYSNGGYVLLGVVIEQVTGMLLRDFVEQEVLAVLGCGDSGFFAFNRLPERTALGYIDDENGEWKTNIYQLPVRGGGDGGLYMTVGDVDRLWRAFFTDNLIRPRTRELAMAKHARINSTLSYGYGVYLSDRFSLPSLRMIGSDAGVGFDSIFVPEEDLIATVVANTTDGHEAVRDAVIGLLANAGNG